MRAKALSKALALALGPPTCCSGLRERERGKLKFSTPQRNLRWQCNRKSLRQMWAAATARPKPLNANQFPSRFLVTTFARRPVVRPLACSPSRLLRLLSPASSLAADGSRDMSQQAARVKPLIEGAKLIPMKLDVRSLARSLATIGPAESLPLWQARRLVFSQAKPAAKFWHLISTRICHNLQGKERASGPPQPGEPGRDAWATISKKLPLLS